MTASILKSPGLSLVCWPISTISSWPLISMFPRDYIFGDCTECINSYWYHRHSFFNSLARSRYLALFLPSFSFSMWLEKSTIRQVIFFCCWLSLGLVVWSRLDDPFVFQNPREFCTSHFPRWIPDYAHTICLYGQV